jgi:hypothetical protein
MICNFCRECKDREIPQYWLDYYCNHGGRIDDVELTSVYAFQCIYDHKIIEYIEILCKTLSESDFEKAAKKALGITNDTL